MDIGSINKVQDEIKRVNKYIDAIIILYNGGKIPYSFIANLETGFAAS